MIERILSATFGFLDTLDDPREARTKILSLLGICLSVGILTTISVVGVYFSTHPEAVGKAIFRKQNIFSSRSAPVLMDYIAEQRSTIGASRIVVAKIDPITSTYEISWVSDADESSSSKWKVGAVGRLGGERHGRADDGDCLLARIGKENVVVAHGNGGSMTNGNDFFVALFFNRELSRFPGVTPSPIVVRQDTPSTERVNLCAVATGWANNLSDYY